MNENAYDLKKRPWYVAMLRGISIAVAFLLIKGVSALILWYIYSASRDSFLVGLAPNFVFLLIFVLSVFMLNSVASIVLTYDPVAAYDYIFAVEEAECSRTRAFFSRDFLIEASFAVGIIAIASSLGASAEIAGILYFGDGLSPHSAGFLPLCVSLVLSSLIILYARSGALRYWLYLKNHLELYFIESKMRLLVRIISVAVLYPLVSPMSPLLVFAIYTVIMMIVSIAVSMTLPIFFLAVVLIALALYFGSFALKARKRAKFFRSADELLKPMGYEISEVRNVYRSLLSPKHFCSFVLKRGRAVYSCLIFTSARYRVPLCFDSSRLAYYRYRIGTKAHNITIQTRFEYAFADIEKAKRIVIIDPPVKDVLIQDGDKERRLFNADSLWDMVIYEADAFIGAAERECLGKSEVIRI